MATIVWTERWLDSAEELMVAKMGGVAEKDFFLK